MLGYLLSYGKAAHIVGLGTVYMDSKMRRRGNGGLIFIIFSRAGTG
ncbi:MAG: hypothetical protein R2819_02225 [Allomuricauda sp.]